MKTLCILTVAALVLPSSAMAQAAPPDERSAYIDCLIAAVDQFEKSGEPVPVIVTATFGQCDAQEEALRTLAKAKFGTGSRRVVDDHKKNLAPILTARVLRARSAKGPEGIEARLEEAMTCSDAGASAPKYRSMSLAAAADEVVASCEPQWRAFEMTLAQYGDGPQIYRDLRSKHRQKLIEALSKSR